MGVVGKYRHSLSKHRCAGAGSRFSSAQTEPVKPSSDESALQQTDSAER